MKKRINIYVVLLTILGLSGCLMDVSYYRHLPTDNLGRTSDGFGRKVTSKTFENGKEFVRDGVLMIPDFGEMDLLYASPMAWVGFYSKSNRVIYIEKITLAREDTGKVLEFKILKNIQINKKMHPDGFYEGLAVLFKEKEPSLKQLMGANQIIFTLYYSFDEVPKCRKIKKINFNLELVKRKDIAWET